MEINGIVALCNDCKQKATKYWHTGTPLCEQHYSQWEKKDDDFRKELENELRGTKNKKDKEKKLKSKKNIISLSDY